MDLNELKAMMAASLLAGCVVNSTKNDALTVTKIYDSEITAAVEIAQKIWDETLKQDA